MVCSPHRLQDLLNHRVLNILVPSRIQEFHLLFLENPDIKLQAFTPTPESGYPSPITGDYGLIPFLP